MDDRTRIATSILSGMAKGAEKLTKPDGKRLVRKAVELADELVLELAKGDPVERTIKGPKPWMCPHCNTPRGFEDSKCPKCGFYGMAVAS